MSVSPDGDRMVMLSFVYSNNTFPCKTLCISLFLGRYQTRYENKVGILNVYYSGIKRQNDCIGFRLC